MWESLHDHKLRDHAWNGFFFCVVGSKAVGNVATGYMGAGYRWRGHLFSCVIAD